MHAIFLSITGIALLLALPAAALLAVLGARRPATAALLRTLVVIGSSVPAVALARLEASCRLVISTRGTCA